MGISLISDESTTPLSINILETEEKSKKSTRAYLLISKASRTFQPMRRRTEVAARRRPSLAPAAVAGGDQRMLSRKGYGPRTTPDHKM